MPKRVVLIHPDGMRQICGVVEETTELPITVEGFSALGRDVPFASLVRVTARAAYYKEPMVPSSYSFHSAQR